MCSFLDKQDMAPLLPDNDGGVVDMVQASADIWLRSCTYTGEGDQAAEDVDLIVEGAISKAGNDTLYGIADRGPGNGLKQHVDGVGETATFWTDDSLHSLGMIAAWHGRAIGITTYAVDPEPTKDQLVPLIVKVIGQLP